MMAVGSIPAYAGEPWAERDAERMRRVYPRVCGGTGSGAKAIIKSDGLSPRMRGNHRYATRGKQSGGSIPAYAGEPSGVRQMRVRLRVYPRVCGGTPDYRALVIRKSGLSPRMRGNHPARCLFINPARSIPAYAGEPLPSGIRTYAVRVYPRVCGGTSPRAPLPPVPEGLSPRMRGNPSGYTRGNRIIGSIPAYAGEPRRGQAVEIRGQVYPRVCGGTQGRQPPGQPPRGLSPRMRGNPLRNWHRAANPGSIPAYAGEPGGWPTGTGQREVYPRVCGGTRKEPIGGMTSTGLSPRMRGNRRHAASPAGCQRSIPAYAGEPTFPRHRPAAQKVYPRVCGGTMIQIGGMAVKRGLSPRMRGNPRPAAFNPTLTRSIPAYAGEPAIAAINFGAIGVYPRVCGGTRRRWIRWWRAWGLSPRMRGNREITE